MDLLAEAKPLLLSPSSPAGLHSLSRWTDATQRSEPQPSPPVHRGPRESRRLQRGLGTVKT